MTSRRFAELRAPQVNELLSESSILIQPFGAIEQHGPHLPFNTDLVVAQAVGDAVVDAYGDDLDLWLLPALAYTKSNEHAWSPGSIWLGPETMLRVIDDIARSVAPLPSRKVVFLNGHGGNSSLLSVALREVRLHHGLMTFLMHPSVPPDQGGVSSEAEHGMGIHGGLGETSLMLHLRPDLVDMGVASRNIPGALKHNSHVGFGKPVPFGWLSNDFGPDGHIGDPTGATAERGRARFDAAVATLGEALREVVAFEFPLSGGGF
jgi:creatinine amidohydrolase